MHIDVYLVNRGHNFWSVGCIFLIEACIQTKVQIYELNRRHIGIEHPDQLYMNTLKIDVQVFFASDFQENISPFIYIHCNASIISHCFDFF